MQAFISHYPHKRDQLHTNEILYVDDKLVSENGEYFAILQGDANFVVYTKDNHPIWASNTYGKAHGGYLHLIC